MVVEGWRGGGVKGDSRQVWMEGDSTVIGGRLTTASFSQILTFKNLMKRNRDRVSALGGHAQNSAIALPFIIVNTGKKTTIDCSISSDK